MTVAIIMRKENNRIPGINTFSLPGSNVPAFFFLHKIYIIVAKSNVPPIHMQIAEGRSIISFKQYPARILFQKTKGGAKLVCYWKKYIKFASL
jgi:hypothetical protein